MLVRPHLPICHLPGMDALRTGASRSWYTARLRRCGEAYRTTAAALPLYFDDLIPNSRLIEVSKGRLPFTHGLRVRGRTT